MELHLLRALSVILWLQLTEAELACSAAIGRHLSVSLAYSLHFIAKPACKFRQFMMMVEYRIALASTCRFTCQDW